MAELILLKREYVQDLDGSTTQWREYLFNTADPDGPIFQNLVINSTVFELTSGDLVWTNPDTGDTYEYNGAAGVTKTAGAGPTTPPPLPDLDDPYGLRFVHEFTNWQDDTIRFEIYKKDYTDPSEEVEGAAESLRLRYENEGKVFVPFRGSRMDSTLHSSTSRKFYEIFEGDERDYYGRLLINGTAKWTGWATPDIFNEPWGNGPFQTSIAFNDGIGGLKDLPFPDVNDNGYTGTVTEKDAIVACLNQTGLRLSINFAVNLTENSMDTFSHPLEQSSVNVEAFVNLSRGEEQPISAYDALQKICNSYNIVIFQQDNQWWVVREPELYTNPLIYQTFDADGVAGLTSTIDPQRTFSGESISLTGAMLETRPAFSNVAVSQEYGELLVENGNFAKNGNFENWTSLVNGPWTYWVLDDWTYDGLNPWPLNDGTNYGRVRRRTESTGLESVNNLIHIYDVVRSFADPVGRLISDPVPIKQEVGNLIQIKFKVRCNTYGSDSRLVEAYFNIAVKCGTQWLETDGSGGYSWTGTESRLSWEIKEVKRWEEITLPAVAIPEDGNIQVYLYQIVQVGSVSKVQYVCDYDDVEIRLVDNPALQNARIYYKTDNPDTFTSTLEEKTIELGDVATVMSQNAKIIDDAPSDLWKRSVVVEALPLAEIICREYANQYQRTTYRLKSGSTNSLTAPLSLLATYEDTVNESGRKFILTGGEWNIKSMRWRPDFVEINQSESTVDIRQVTELKSGSDQNSGTNNSGVGNSGVSDEVGTEAPTPPTAPIDLGDQDDIIPIIKDGAFEDSKISASRDSANEIIQHAFPNRVKGVEAEDDDEFVIKSQLPQITEYGLLSGGTIQWTGTGFVYQSSLAVVAIGETLIAPAAQITLDAADATNDRFDVIGWRYVSTGVAELFYLKGTAAANPTIPQVDPETEVEGLVILVEANTTVPSGVTNEDVYLENTEWAVTSVNTGTVNADSTTDPLEGTKSVEVSDPENNLRIRFTRGSDVDVSGITSLGIILKLKTTWSNQHRLSVRFLNVSNQSVSNSRTLRIDKTSTGEQFVGIDLAQFTFNSFVVRGLEIRFTDRSGQGVDGFYLDNVRLQGGVDQPISGQNFLALTDTPSDYTGQAEKILQVKADETGLEFVENSGEGITNLDGGFANSTYLVSQNIDGGTA